jgi:hypothetical protein
MQWVNADVRFGSKADIAEGLTNVCFTSESGPLDSSGRGGSLRNMQREIDANWSRQSRQFAAAVAVFVVIGIDAWLSFRTMPSGALARSSTFNPLITPSGPKLISHSHDFLLGPE